MIETNAGTCETHDKILISRTTEKKALVYQWLATEIRLLHLNLNEYETPQRITNIILQFSVTINRLPSVTTWSDALSIYFNIMINCSVPCNHSDIICHFSIL